MPSSILKRRPVVFWVSTAALALPLMARNIWNVPVLETGIANAVLIILFIYVILHALLHG